MTPTPHEEPLAEVGREPLHEAIADARQERRGGISIQTLGVASVASAAASFTASHLWGPGTIASAALTPIVVALVSEFLRRPVNRVSATAQRVAPIVARPPAPAPGQRPAHPPAPTAPQAPSPSQPEPPRQAWRPRWGLILGTGLLAFAIVVGVYTVPDLLVGHSITGAGGSTTFFSGGGSPAPTTTVTTTVPTQTETQTVQVQTVTTTVPSTTPAAPPATTTTPTTPSTPLAAPDQQLTTTATTPTTPTGTSTTPTTP